MTNPTSSLINFGSIDATYPVAGQDNNSQGFRDNFGAIKSGLGQASTEITSLQQNAAFVNASNNFGSNAITNAIYNQFYGRFTPLGTVSTNQDINLQLGPVQSVYLSGDVTLTFRNWPAAGSYGLIRLFLFSDGSGVRQPTFSTAAGSGLKYETNFPLLPNSTTPGIVLGGEKVSSVTVSNPGSGYTSGVAVGFSGGSQQATGSTATATANYKVVSGTVIGGYPGNGYALNDTITINANTNVVFSVSSLNLTFTGNTTNGLNRITQISNILNLGPRVAVSGVGIPAGAEVSSAGVQGSVGGADGYYVVLVSSTDHSTATNCTADGTAITVTYVSSTGPIGALTVTNGGTFSSPIVGSYDTSPIIGTGYGARLVLSFGVNLITVTYGGNGYTATPAVTFTGGGGTNTAASASITTGTANNPKVIEASTYDGGTTVYMRFIGEYD
jgi:hypothetical protein